MIFSVLDCSDAFYRLPLHTDSRQVTAFQAGSQQYVFNRVPMGLATSAGILCKVMRKILGDYLGKFVLNYMDDVLIYSPDHDTHLEHIDLVLQGLIIDEQILNVSIVLAVVKKRSALLVREEIVIQWNIHIISRGPFPKIVLCYFRALL